MANRQVVKEVKGVMGEGEELRVPPEAAVSFTWIPDNRYAVFHP